MYKKIKIHKAKRNIMIILFLVLFLVWGFLWYRELGTNREVPKKAKFVSTFILKGDIYR
ncbi:hypothetical protein [Schnuerera sp.]|uniref:hypothetical protein n=1 Tax=Schnuerera sp. TaxID=2794844 RepID=UPI002CDD8DA1|nr:hypothetical protein [Schnuerera sp.]HSH36437.1 hypothetical protein [Schnuerera sp.]